MCSRLRQTPCYVRSALFFLFFCFVKVHLIVLSADFTRTSLVTYFSVTWLYSLFLPLIRLDWLQWCPRARENTTVASACSCICVCVSLPLFRSLSHLVIYIANTCRFCLFVAVFISNLPHTTNEISIKHISIDAWNTVSKRYLLFFFLFLLDVFNHVDTSFKVWFVTRMDMLSHDQREKVSLTHSECLPDQYMHAFSLSLHSMVTERERKAKKQNLFISFASPVISSSLSNTLSLSLLDLKCDFT